MKNKKSQFLNWQMISRFFKPAASLKSLIGIVLFQSTIWTLGGLFLIYLNEQITIATELGSKQMITEYLVIFGLLLCISFLGLLFFAKYEAVIIYRIQSKLYKEKLTETIGLDNNMFESIGTGYFNSVLQRGVDNRAGLLESFFSRGVKSFLQIIFSFVLIYSGAGIIGVSIAFVGLVIAIIVMNRGTRISLVWRRKKRKLFGILDKQIVRVIMSKFLVLSNNKIDQENTILDRRMEKIIHYHKYGDWTGISISYFIPKFFNEIVRGLVYFYVGIGVIDGTYSIADFVLLISIVELFRHALENVTSIYREFAKNFIYVSRLWALFDTIPQIDLKENNPSIRLDAGRVDIKNLSYQYSQIEAIDSIETGQRKSSDGVKVFDRLSLTIEGGKKTAFVGASGSGKSTLMKLIAGYLSPDAGTITVDGQDLTTISLQSYYKQIGYLTQEAGVFDGSLRENLMYGIVDDVDDTALDKAIRLAKCDFIYDFAQGLETEIGERGIRLSGGQRQRLAIAKVFLKDPAIVMLDEPTSALDSFSEEAISDAMHNLFEGRTVIIIAHRLQTVKEADDIIVFDQGTIIERGNHASLIKQGGHYKKMLVLQSGF